MDLTQEKKLVLMAKQNPESFGELYNYYFPKVYAFVASKIEEKDLAEDIVSDVFIKILENLGRYEWRGLPFGAWVFRIARNAINDYFREHYKKHTVDIDQIKSIKDETIHSSPHEKTIKNELKEIVAKVLKILNQNELEVIKLKFFSELSNKEIAKTLNLTETNVGVILFRTLKKIKPDLELVKIKIENYLLMFSSIFVL